METNVKVGEKSFHKNSSFSENLKKMEPYLELGAAILSGVLIIIGWVLAKYELQTASVITYLFAFIIGGFAKAREGILDTIENKQLNVELLMILAAIGSAIIGYWNEGAILIFIFALSGAMETYTMSKSSKEISSLMQLQPEEAWLLKNGIEKKVPVEQLQIGDEILVKPGERIPADGIIIKGRTSIDESAITGESLPVNKTLKDEIFAGTVNGTGSITVEITKRSNETLFQKIIELVQNAQSEKSPSQQFIERFEGTYVKIVLLVVVLMIFLPHYALGWSWTDSFYRAMILLVVASPCALVASITPATLSAISNGARKGILFKGGVHLEALGNLQAIAFDKTGTLTKGKPEVTDFIVNEKVDRKEIIRIVASIENHSNHPLAQAIVRYALQKQHVTLMEPDLVEDVSGWGIRAVVNGAEWKLGKQDFVNTSSAAQLIDDAKKLTTEGKSIVFVQKENEVIALIGLKDIVREETITAIQQLHELGIIGFMLTGDNKNTANAIASEIGLKEYIAECLPEQKVHEVQKIKENFDVVAMVGDGINDAPALATANVGIAMGEGTDVALETADVVLMKNDLTKIASAVKLSRKMNRIIKQNIVFSISVIMLLVVSNFLQFIDLPFGVIGHEGSTILVILNGLRLLRGN
ncbi:heavy metal translocating P-type ATPase [Bacillus kwashiorkori]|uniref:heavy metal translocating P-type ATPase n=1 Tax=Bacillus kwashiorkori TaxID=1522318 RepID=UPI000981D84A|nr:heavy metal translocating P-type ATPase [Bacillus kwashiorkori]